MLTALLPSSTTSTPLAPPRTPTTSPPTSPVGESGVDCTICWDSIDAEQGQLTHLQSCSHNYHPSCIARWVNTTAANLGCPCCRSPLSLKQRLSLIQAAGENVTPQQTCAEPSTPGDSLRRSGVFCRSFLRSASSAIVDAIGSLVLSPGIESLNNNPRMLFITSLLGSAFTSWIPELRNNRRVDFTQLTFSLGSQILNPVLGHLVTAQTDIRQLSTAAMSGAAGSIACLTLTIPLEYLFAMWRALDLAEPSTTSANEAHPAHLKGFYQGVEEGLRAGEEASQADTSQRSRQGHTKEEALQHALIAYRPEHSEHDTPEQLVSRFQHGFNTGFERGFSEAFNDYTASNVAGGFAETQSPIRTGATVTQTAITRSAAIEPALTDGALSEVARILSRFQAYH